MKIKFHKMHGLGNDFIIVDQEENKDLVDLNKEQVIFLCDRKIGIGCDQLIVVKREENLLKMIVYNQNGSTASFCGNATRCIIGLLTKDNDKIINIKTGNGTLKGWKNNNFITINIGKVILDWKKIPLSKKTNNNEINFGINSIGKGFCVNVGNPHIVFFVENFNFNLSTIGEKIQNDQNFPNNINVNFAQIINRNSIKLKTYERGVGLTNACGSGACASFFTANYKNLVSDKVQVLFDLGSLEISFDKEKNILMKGDYSYAFLGEIKI